MNEWILKMWKLLWSWITKVFPPEGSTMGSPEGKKKAGHGHVALCDEASTMGSPEGKRKAGHGHVALCDEASTMGSPEGKKKAGHGHVALCDETSTMGSAEGKRKAGHENDALCARLPKRREKESRGLEKRKTSRRFLQSSSSEDNTSSDYSPGLQIHSEGPNVIVGNGLNGFISRRSNMRSRRNMEKVGRWT